MDSSNRMNTNESRKTHRNGTNIQDTKSSLFAAISLLTEKALFCLVQMVRPFRWTPPRSCQRTQRGKEKQYFE